MILNERILRLIITLAEELHFGRAAATLHVSQPALSGTVKSAERDLGVRLFKRTSRNVELTHAGNVFVAEARRLLSEGERAVALVRGSSSDILGPLHIGYPACMNLRWLGSLMTRARTNASLGADLHFISSEAVNLHEELVKRTLHAAFFTGPLRLPDVGDLQSVTLFREPFSVAIGSKHPLARHHVLSFDQLQLEPVVWLCREANPELHDGFMALCAAHGYHPKTVQAVRTFYECLQFAREGLGITFLPSFMKANHQGDEPVVFRALPENSLHLEYTLAYRRNGDSNGVDRFVRFVQDHIPQKPAPALKLA